MTIEGVTPRNFAVRMATVDIEIMVDIPKPDKKYKTLGAGLHTAIDRWEIHTRTCIGRVRALLLPAKPAFYLALALHRSIACIAGNGVQASFS